MNAFHIFWTPSQEKRDFRDYFVLTLILSAMQWRKTNPGRFTFYGDRRTVEYLDKQGLCSLWSDCDGETLDRETDLEHYDVKTFFTIGKFLAFLQEQAPCALVDVDLVIWKNLDGILKGKEAAFTHWEEPDVSSPWYCGPEKLSVRPGYQFHPEWDFAQTAANTSFIYFKEDWLKEYYVECALQYMHDNFVRNRTKENPELIFVEQRLLTMCCKERQVMDKVGPLMDITWDAREGRLIPGKGMPKGWPFFEWDNGCLATHTWIAKQAIDKNEPYRNYMCCQAIEKILKLDHRMYDVLEKIDSITKYLDMLYEYKTSAGVLKAGVGSASLYDSGKV